MRLHLTPRIETIARAPSRGADSLYFEDCRERCSLLQNAIAARRGTLPSGLARRLNKGDLETQALDYGSPPSHAFLQRQREFDPVLSFAALKHARSEPDDHFLAMVRAQGYGRVGSACSVGPRREEQNKVIQAVLEAGSYAGTAQTAAEPLPSVTKGERDITTI